MVGAPFYTAFAATVSGQRARMYGVRADVAVRGAEVLSQRLDVLRQGGSITTFRLVYVVEVRRGDETNEFYVDAATGSVVARTPTPRP